MKKKNWLNNKNKLGLIGAGILSIVVFAIITFSVIVINQNITTQTAKSSDVSNYPEEEATNTYIELAADDDQKEQDSKEETSETDSEENLDEDDSIEELDNEEAEDVHREENNDKYTVSNTNNDNEKPVNKPNKEENESNTSNQGNTTSEKEPVKKPEKEDEVGVKDDAEEPEEEDSTPVITTKTVQKTESIKYETIEKEDSSLTAGNRIVIQNGKEGVRTITFEKTYKDGKLISTEQTSSVVTKKPINEIILVGSKTDEPTIEEDE
ncbi:G5 domain-containing protein [Paraliobacillus salinarum]|uniref:G5 domain-containing protein n=1 Tax=Paraliobacillus salinarum TaxID=1158996 RepID=UPI0015F730EF|nr:G5 domain-containing protein [Paraliobacillus salinarum]